MDTVSLRYSTKRPLRPTVASLSLPKVRRVTFDDTTDAEDPQETVSKRAMSVPLRLAILKASNQTLSTDDHRRAARVSSAHLAEEDDAFWRARREAVAAAAAPAGQRKAARQPESVFGIMSAPQQKRATSRATMLQRRDAALKRVTEHSLRLEKRGYNLSKSLSVLEELSITEATQQTYLKSARVFQQWMDKQQLFPATHGEVILRLLEFLDEMFFEGLSHQDGSRMWAAVHFLLPGLDGHQLTSRVQRALKGWSRRAPTSSRFPLPRALVMALAAHAVLQNRVLEALAFILGFLTYLRPGALVGLSAASLIPPTPLLGRATWGIVVSPTEEGKPTKTGEWDQSLLLDNPDFDWLDGPLRELFEGRDPRGSLWPFDMATYGKAFHTSLTELGIDSSGMSVYQLRHSGASHELLCGIRTYEGVKQRGGWHSDSSMQRYAKVARAQQLANALPVGVLAFGAKCEPILAAAFISGNFKPLTELNDKMKPTLDQRPLASLSSGQQNELLGWTP